MQHKKNEGWALAGGTAPQGEQRAIMKGRMLPCCVKLEVGLPLQLSALADVIVDWARRGPF